MQTALAVLLFAVGLVLIIKGGDIFVDAASWMAVKSGIPKFLIGATVVSFATTLPELLVSIFAAVEGKVDMSVGNAVGSVTANTGLILALSAICIPSIVNRREFGLKAVMLMTAALIIMLFGFSGQIGLLPSILLIVIYVLFLAESIISAQRSAGKPHSDAEIPAETTSTDDDSPDAITRLLSRAVHGHETALNLVKFVLGTAGIVLGARLLVDNGTLIANALHVPEGIISVTMIAIGTSLPELITMIASVRKHEASLSVGNIIGANIMDLTIIMPLSALISGQALGISGQGRVLDLPACALLTLVALVPMLLRGKISRMQGAIMLILYLTYVALVVLKVAG